MSLSIRQWLAEYNIQLTQLRMPTAQMTGVAFRLVQDMQVKSLTPFDICPLAELLELSWSVAWPQMRPLANLTVELLRTLNRKKPLRRNEGTWLAFQIAYIHALDAVLGQENQFRRPWLDRTSLLTAAVTDQGKQSLNDPQLQGLLKTLRPGRLSDTQAEQALLSLNESFLVQQMNNLAQAWLMANGAEETEAKLLVQRLLYGLPGYLLPVVAANPLPLAQLQRFVRLGNVTTNRNVIQGLPENENLDLSANTEVSPLPFGTSAASSLDLQREEYRASLVQSLTSPVLEEIFALPDLYIPLRGEEFSSISEEESQPPASVDLIEWATQQLADLETIAMIEAPAGCGKTSFCQIWAAKIAQELYPAWMPVLIRLRDATLGRTLEQTLDSAFPKAKFTRVDGWLSPLGPPCLLILDGLDQLPRSGHIERHLSGFLDQVKQFLFHSTNSPGRPRHKVVITCRQDILSEAYSSTPLQSHSLSQEFRRLAIQPLDQEQLKHWFKQWSKVQSKSIAQAYFNFLKQNGVFHFRADLRDVSIMIHQPLMLLLLGILYRDGRIDESILPLSRSQVRFEIHDRMCRWLLGESPDGMSSSEKIPVAARDGLAHACRSSEAIANLLEGRSPQAMRQQMQQAALAILISDRKSVVRQGSDQEQPALPGLYFQSLNSPASGQHQREFSHLSLGEYLAANAIAQKLKAIAQKVADAYGEIDFKINSPVAVAELVYQLLSFGVLSQETEELIIESLRREEARDRSAFSFEILCDRLDRFFRSYGRGRWLDAGMAHNLHAQATVPQGLNVLQIDATVGLNVFVLLCAAHREAAMPFLPCGDPGIPEEFNRDQLLSLIGRTTALSPIAFWQRARLKLERVDLGGACLNYAMLAGANFWKTNLFSAQLAGANLAQANLQEANLSWANLTGANLSGANLSAAKLEGANLTGANLIGATLQLASLTNTCLYQAQMDALAKDFAQKNGALFSLKQYQACQKALADLELPRNTRVGENDQGDSTLLLIERAQGSVISPTDYNDFDANDDTALL